MNQTFKISTIIFIVILMCLKAESLSAQIKFTIAKTDVTCTNNGSIVVDTTGSVTTKTITYAIKKATDTDFNPPQAENYFYGLGPDTYVVAVYEELDAHESAPITLTNKSYSGMIIATKTSGNALITCCDPDGSVTIGVTSGTGSSPFTYILKKGTDTIAIKKGSATRPYDNVTFTQLATGSYTVDVKDGCGYTLNSGNISVTSKYDFSDVTFGSLDGMGSPTMKSTGCDVSMSFATNNITLIDDVGKILFNRSNPQINMPNTLPIQVCVEYPANSDNWTDWQSVFSSFVLSGYSPDKSTYRVKMRHPCDAQNTVISPVYTLTAGQPYSVKSGFCIPYILHNIASYYCGPVKIELKIGGVTKETYNWDGVGTSYTPDLSSLSDGTYNTFITVNGVTYQTNDIKTGGVISAGFGSSQSDYNWACTKGCDFNTFTLRTYATGWPADNAIPISFSITSGPVTRDTVTLFQQGKIWTDLPNGTYTVHVDYGGCRSEDKSFTVSMPFTGFESGSLSYVPGTTCGTYNIIGIGRYIKPVDVIDNTTTYDVEIYKESLPAGSGVYTIHSTVKLIKSNSQFTSTDLAPGNYKVSFVSSVHSQNICAYTQAEKYINIPFYSTIDIDVPNSGGMICPGSGLGEIFVATTGGSGKPLTYRLKTAAGTGSVLRNWQSSPTFSNLAAGLYYVDVHDACGTDASDRQITLKAVANTVYFDLSGRTYANGSVTATCDGQDATLNLKIIGQVSNIQWTYPDGSNGPTTKNLIIPDFTDANVGKYKISFYNSGCFWKDSITIGVEKNVPSFELTHDITVCDHLDMTTDLQVISGSTAGLTMLYYNKDYSKKLTDSEAKNVIQTGIYHIVGMNSGGCTDTSTVDAKVRRLNDNAVTDVLYVKKIPGGAGDGTGRNWDNAFDGDFLAQYLLTKATASTKIYVAEGTYYPGLTNCSGPNVTRTDAFVLNAASVELHGGYAANATGTDRSSYDPKTHITRLSGNIGVAGVANDNSYNVVRITKAGCLLDGFYVSDGYADGAVSPNNLGGGIYASLATTLSNLVVENNYSKTTGGGISAAGVLTLSNSTVRNNSALTAGGGINATTPTISNSTIKNNTAKTSGGGIYAITLVISGSTVSNNAALQNGGGISATTATFSGNDTILNNKAGYNTSTSGYAGNFYGGGIYVTGSLTASDTLVCNNNNTSLNGGGIYKGLTANTTFTATGLKLLQVNGNGAGKGVATGAGGGIWTNFPLDLGNLRQGIISNNTSASAGGGIYAVDVMTIKNSNLSGNIGSSGGAIYVKSGGLTVQNSVLTNNISQAGSGGAICVQGASTGVPVLFENITVSGNKAGYNVSTSTWTVLGSGGGIQLETSVVNCTLKGTILVENNIAGNAGGGICHNGAAGSSITGTIASGLNSLTVINNTSAKSGSTTSNTGGGGIYANATTSLSLDNVTIKNNISMTSPTNIHKGGGIYAGSSLTLGGTNDISYNTSPSDGGGIYVGGVFNIRGNNTISNNSATTSGGGIYAVAAATLDNVTVSNNKAGWNGTAFAGTYYGGGIFAASSATITNSTIQNNTATSFGGGAYLSVASTVTNSTFYTNISTTAYGSAIYSKVTGSNISFCTFYGNDNPSNPISIVSVITSNTFNGNIVQDNIGVMSTLGFKGAYNIVGSSNDITGLGGTTNKLNVNPALLFSNTSLTDNGGATKTLLLKKGGAAHNFIPATAGISTAKDQRNLARPVSCGYDAGAVELQASESDPAGTAAFKYAPALSVCGVTKLKFDSLVTTSNIKDTLFYQKKDFTVGIPRPYVPTVDKDITVYVKFVTTSNCEINDSIKVKYNPMPESPIITNRAFCESGTIAGLAARVTNAVAGGTVHIYATANGNSPLPPATALVDGTTYYVSQTSDKGCETPRVAIPVTIQQTPVLTVTTDNAFLCETSNFTLHGSVTNTSLITFYQWQVMNPATGVYAPGNSEDFYPAVTVPVGVTQIDNTIFTPSPSTYDSNGDIHVKLRVSTGACGYKEDIIILHKSVSNPVAAITIESEPVTNQQVCQDTSYVVKVKDIGQGGLTDINVALSDWKFTELKVLGAEYMYPVEGGTWHSLTPDNSADSYNHIVQIPQDVKMNGDSLLVRFKVQPGCGFFAGSSMKFTVNGYGSCHNTMVAEKSVESGIFHLDLHSASTAKYEMASHLSASMVTNATANPKKITWKVDYYRLTSGTASINDSIYFRIPAGMTLDLSSFPPSSGVKVNGTSTLAADQGIEYVMPLSVSVLNSTPGAEVSFSFDFTVSTAAKCGIEQLYMEIIRQSDLTCPSESQTCTFFETLAHSYPQLSVEWYQLQMSKTPASIGIVQNGKWTGVLNLQTATDVYANSVIPFDFYIDENGNAIKDAADTPTGIVFNYTVPNPVPAGGSFDVNITTPVSITSDLNSRPLELLAYVPAAELVCEALTVPIVPLTGKETPCQGDTVIFRTTPGMQSPTFTLVDAVSGATPKRISAEGNGNDWTLDTDKSQARVVVLYTKPFSVKAQYRLPADNQLLNGSVMRVTPTARPVLALTGAASRAVCKGRGVDLSQVAHDTNSASPDTWYYHKKESNGSYTLLATLSTGAPHIVSPTVNTVYGISAAAGAQNCQSNIIDFTVTVNPNPDFSVNNIAICQGTPVDLVTAVYNLQNATIGNLSFSASDADFDNQRITNPYTSYVAGSQTIYVRATNANGCISDTVAVTINTQPSPAAPVTTGVTWCQDDVATALSVVAVSGQTAQWYTSAIGGTATTIAPTPLTVTAGVTIYYVSYTNNVTGCESARIPLTVTINPQPADPATTDVSYCLNDVATALDVAAVSGQTAQWYTSAFGGTATTVAPTPQTATVGVTTYYVSYTNDVTGCESARIPLTVTIDALPSAPATTDVSYCQNDIATVLSVAGVSGQTAQWYTSATGGTATTVAPTPLTATVGITIWYVSYTNAIGCESARTPLAVTVNPLPATPAINSVNEACAGDRVILDTTTGYAGYQWNVTPDGTPEGAGDAYREYFHWSTTGTKTLTVTVTDDNGCSNTATKNVVINLRSETGPLYRLPNGQ